MAQLLGATGGSWELPKCSYHLLHCRLSMQGAPVLASCPQEYCSIDVLDPESGIEQTLEYLPPHESVMNFWRGQNGAWPQVQSTGRCLCSTLQLLFARRVWIISAQRQPLPESNSLIMMIKMWTGRPWQQFFGNVQNKRETIVETVRV